jgi:hypothetical protein
MISFFISTLFSFFASAGTRKRWPAGQQEMPAAFGSRHF